MWSTQQSIVKSSTTTREFFVYVDSSIGSVHKAPSSQVWKIKAAKETLVNTISFDASCCGLVHIVLFCFFDSGFFFHEFNHSTEKNV